MTDLQYKFVDGEWRDTFSDCPAIETATFLGMGLVEAIAMDGWCGCGAPQVIIDALAAYLGQQTNGITIGFSDDLTGWLIAYRADELGLTEHGTSLSYAWLTDAGRSWLELLEAEVEPEENE